jgi:hypothetical protein
MRPAPKGMPSDEVLRYRLCTISVRTELRCVEHRLYKVGPEQYPHSPLGVKKPRYPRASGLSSSLELEHGSFLLLVSDDD